MHNRVSPWSSEETPIDTQWIGDYGELIAASYLRTKGFKILKQNFRWGDSGEVDIVLRQGDTLIFTEVKTRRSTEYRSALAAVDAKKRQLIRRGARHWCTLLWRDDINTRFDVVEVVLPAQQRPQITLHEGVFGAKESQARPLYANY